MNESKSVSKDPVCGMTVDEPTALHVERDGKTFYFCSDHCRNKFLATLAGAKPEPRSGCCCNNERTMTMNESKSVTKDPICGMSVDKATALHAERDGTTFYFCSDHCRHTFLSMPAGAKPEEKAGGCCG